MAKKKIRSALRRSIAVLSSLALLTSASSPVYMQANAAVADTVASSDEDGRASKIYIYDEYGNDISETPIIYLDNSSGAGQATRKRITVKIVNPDKPVNEYIKAWLPDQGASNQDASNQDSIISASVISQGFDPDDPGVFVGVFDIYACQVNDATVKDPYTNEDRTVRSETSNKPGKSYMIFTSQHGGVSRQLDIVVQEPAKDFNVFRTTSDGKSAQLDLNDSNFYNTHPGLLTTANHKYRFTTSLITDHPNASPDYLDKIEWYVFESGDDGDTPTNFKATDKAEISQDGVFTPKKNGVVWIVAVPAPTAAAAKKQEMVNKAIAANLLSADEINYTTPEDYLRKWVGNNLYDSNSLRLKQDDYALSPLKYYFTTPAAPFNQIITDRPFAIGNKTRWIKTMERDKETSTLHQRTDDKGNPVYAQTKVDFEGIRYDYFGLKSGYWTESVKNGTSTIEVLGADPQFNSSKTDIQYLPVVNTPKYINITIREENPAKDLRISKFPNYMEPGEISQLELVATPTNNAHVDGHEAGATDEWRWVSENEDIVSIDENGLVTAKKEGTASIKVYGETQRDDGSYVSAGCTIQVITKATELRVTPSPTSTRVGVPVILTATAAPETSTDRIIWESTNENIATVTPTVEGALTNVQTARVVGVSEGNCEIIARSEASGVEANRCKVTVSARNESDALKLTTPTPAGATDVINDLDVFTFRELTINGRLVTDDGETSADDSVHWEVLDNEGENVAVLEQTAESITLRGQIKGDIRIRAMSQAQYEEYEKNPSSGLPVTTKTINVHVKRSCDKINVTDGQTAAAIKNVNVNTGLQLSADLLRDYSHPYEHDDTLSYWMSTDPEIVSVDNNGYITAKKNGTAYIFAYSKSGVSGKLQIKAFTTTSAAINATGTALVDDVLTKELTADTSLKTTFKFNSIIKDEDNKQLTADCKWTSSNPDVGQIDNNGNLTVTDVGETLVTLYSGTLREECLVKVTAPINAAMTDTLAPILYTPTISSYEPHPTFKVYSTDDAGNIVEKHELVENLDYEISYQNNTSVSTQARMIITGLGKYQGTKQIPFTIAARPMSDPEITIEYETPKQAMKTATVQDNLRVECSTIPLEEKVDYNVTYQNNSKVGKATMIVTGIGKYTSSVSKEFEIFCDHPEILNPIITPATYTEPGDEFGTCAICGQKDVHRYLPPLSASANPASSISFERDFYGVEAPRGETVITPVLVGQDPSQPATDILTWSSSNPKVATVEPEYDENGALTGNAVVKAVTKGTTTITAFGEKEEVTANCEVKVLTPITKVDLVSKRVDTRVGVPVEVNASVEPSSTEDELVWSVLDPTIAAVEQGTAKGGLTPIVTGLRTGTTRLIAKGKYTDYTNSFELKVTDRIVSDNISITVQRGDNVEEQDRIPAGMDSNVPTYKCFTNDDIRFHAQLMDNNGGSADGTVIWKVTNNAGNNVTAMQDVKTGEALYDIKEEYEGLTFPVHAASLGAVTITATSKDDPTIHFVFNLEIAKRCDTITICDSADNVIRAKSINVGDTLYTKAVLKINDPTYPFDHGDAVKSWTSSDENIATVDSNGTIKGISNGTASIKVTALSGQTTFIPVYVFTTSSVYINGLEAPTDGSALVSEKEINKTFDLSVRYTAVVRDQTEKNVSNVDCIWVSSNTDVATVDGSTGLVQLHDVGETVITVSSGAKSRSFTLRVVSPYRNMVYDPIKMYYDPKVKEYKPKIYVYMGFHLLEEGTDYVLSDFENNKGIGNASFKITLLGYYTGEGKINFSIERRPVSDPEVKISKIETQNYTGKPVQPSVTVTHNGTTLEDGVDYAVAYTNNTEEGTATATITGRGAHYIGTQAVEFKIKKNYSGLMGDMDDDGVLTSGDALTVLRKSVGLTNLDDAKFKLADMDGDGNITSADALTVLRKSVGLA